MRLPFAGLTRAWRGLWRPRGFVPLASLALGIGLAAFTSALTMVESLLRAPPFPHHASVVLYGEEDRDPTSRAASPMFYSMIGLPPGVISRGAAQVPESVNVHSGDWDKLVRGQRVDAGFLSTLGIRSAVPEDPSITFEQGVMLSYAFWRDGFHGDPHVVGRNLAIDGAQMTVRGVLPRDYRLFADIDVLLPFVSSGYSSDSAANLVAVARLAPGVSGDVVAQWMRAKLVASPMPGYGEQRPIPSYGTTPIDIVLTGKAKPIVLIFFGSSLLVFAAAGVNLSNLMLTRALRRTQETYLTIAFGGPGRRPMLPIICEVAAISAGAIIIGLPLARLLVLAVRPLIPGSWLLTALPIDVTGRTCLVAVLACASMATAASILGSMPANVDALLRMPMAPRRMSPVGFAQRARRVMLLIQTALATMLLVLGVATVSQWWRVAHIDPGFEAVGASSVEISPDARQFPAIEDVRRIADTIRAATLHLPGVDATGVSTMLPVGSAFFMPFRLASNKKSSLQYGMVSPGAMESMGMTLLAGRTIREGDGATAPAVAIVNQAYLDRVDGHGLGGWVRPAWRLGANRPMRIIGVVADTRSAGADRAAEPTVFVPLAQVDGSVFDFIRRFVPTYVIVRGPGGATIDDQALRKLVHAVAPGLATGPAQSFRHLARQATGQVRRNAAVAALFAGMALSLACIGLYAVQSLEVTDRRREISLRDALGATPMDLVGNLLSRGVGMATPGVALGLVAAVALDRGFAHPALETGELDAGVTAAAALLMTFAALCAVALPSLRASVARTTCLLYGGLAPSPHGQRRSEASRP